jgi:hypothetical protein
MSSMVIEVDILTILAKIGIATYCFQKVYTR